MNIPELVFLTKEDKQAIRRALESYRMLLAAEVNDKPIGSEVSKIVVRGIYHIDSLTYQFDSMLQERG